MSAAVPVALLQKVPLGSKVSYDARMREEGDAEHEAAANVVRFFAALKNRRAKTKPRPEPLELPRYDRYTYRKFGQLLVQHYVGPNQLKAWCLCGNWCIVTNEDLDGEVDACRECQRPGYLDKAVEASARMQVEKMLASKADPKRG
jgi:hypothetical protein